VKPKNEHTPDRPVVIDVASPWKISCIQEGLGGRYDHNTIVEMLRQCRGDIDRAFANLLDEESSASSSLSSSASASSQSSASSATSAGTLAKNPVALPAGFKPCLTSSRSSSRHSSASKRSANDDSDDDTGCPARQRGREQKRRILPNVTVGINFGGQDKRDLVSLRLRVNPDAIVEPAGAAPAKGPIPDDQAADQPKGGRKLRARKHPTKACLAGAAAAASAESADVKIKVESK
jgi:hypothetical protein